MRQELQGQLFVCRILPCSQPLLEKNHVHVDKIMVKGYNIQRRVVFFLKLLGGREQNLDYCILKLLAVILVEYRKQLGVSTKSAAVLPSVH